MFWVVAFQGYRTCSPSRGAFSIFILFIYLFLLAQTGFRSSMNYSSVDELIQRVWSCRYFLKGSVAVDSYDRSVFPYLLPHEGVELREPANPEAGLKVLTLQTDSCCGAGLGRSVSPECCCKTSCCFWTVDKKGKRSVRGDFDGLLETMAGKERRFYPNFS